jgi:hypothetical protein
MSLCPMKTPTLMRNRKRSPTAAGRKPAQGGLDGQKSDTEKAGYTDGQAAVHIDWFLPPFLLAERLGNGTTHRKVRSARDRHG